jgi:hypothetical protein
MKFRLSFKLLSVWETAKAGAKSDGAMPSTSLLSRE